jgi:hypothetical protein
MGIGARGLAVAATIGIAVPTPLALSGGHGRTPVPTPARLTAAAVTCEQRVGVGRIGTEMMSSTEECYKSYTSEVELLSNTFQSIASDCQNQTDTGRSLEAGGLTSEARSGLEQDTKTRNAKVAYFMGEAAWHKEHGPKKTRAETIAAIDEVATAIGKDTLALDGAWSQVEAVASALRNDDCAEADTKAAAETTAARTARAESTTLALWLHRLSHRDLLGGTEPPGARSRCAHPPSSPCTGSPATDLTISDWGRLASSRPYGGNWDLAWPPHAPPIARSITRS